MLKYATTAALRPTATSRRTYATQHGLGAATTPTGPRRKAVTPFNDDGQVPWSDLSAGEKAARATQQTFNLGLILVGVVLTVRVMIELPFFWFLRLGTGLRLTASPL